MNHAVRNAATALHTNRRRAWLMSLFSGPTVARPPAAAAFEVPTAGVPTYFVDSPLRATEVPVDTAVAAAAAGRGGTAVGLAALAAAGAAGAATGVAGSPRSAVTSSSLSGGNPLRFRRACSAATVERLHFFPAATIFATSSLMPAFVSLAAGCAAGAP